MSTENRSRFLPGGPKTLPLQQPTFDFSTLAVPQQTAEPTRQALDQVTVLQCKAPLIATKRVRIENGALKVISGNDKAKLFEFDQEPVNNIHELSTILSKIALESNQFVIRGEPLPGVISALGNYVRRLSNADKETGDAPTFGPAARRWVGFDFDDIELSEEVDLVADPEHAVLLSIKEHLPPEFSHVSCWWQFSSQAQPRSRVLRIRLWFWIDRPVADAEWKAWAKANQVPASVTALFHPVQIHYVAGPVFEGCSDWIPKRFGLLQGERDAVSLPPTPFVGEPEHVDEGTRLEETPELVAQARAHVALMPPSLDQPGNKAMWNTTLALSRGFSLSEGTVLALLREYNERALPPWADDALQHKASEGANNAKGPLDDRARHLPLGYLALCRCKACEEVTGGTRQVAQDALEKHATQLTKSKGAHKAELGALLVKVAAGEPFVDDVRQRSDVIERLTYHLVRHFRGYSPQSIAKLFEPSLEKMKEKDPACPSPEQIYEQLRHAQKKQKGIVISTDITAMADAALAVLAEDGTFFQHGDAIVRIAKTTKPAKRIQSEEEIPVLKVVPFAAIREAVGKAKWFTAEEEGALRPALPPDWVIQSLVAKGNWPTLPNVETLSECPIMRRDGTVASAAGYDEASGVYLIPNAIYPPVPTHPTREQVQAAIDAIDDVLHDFPFELPEHRGAVFAAILSLLGRNTYDDPPPLFVIEATKAGSGKDKLVKLIGIIGTGTSPYSASFTENDEEMKKLITSVAIAGIRIVNFGNVTGTLGGAALCKVLTDCDWSDRILGASQFWAGRLNTVWLATSNNPTLGIDMKRRICGSRLDWGSKGIANPAELPSSYWRHKDVVRYALENRPKLVTSGLTILRAYFAAGCPEQETSSWGSYESWTRTILGALKFAGLPDPGPAREAFAMRANFEENLKEQFVTAFLWLFEKVHSEKPMLAADVLTSIRDRKDPHAKAGAFNFNFELGEQYDLLTETLQGLTLSDETERTVLIKSPSGDLKTKPALPNTRALGKLLGSLNGTLFDITPRSPLPEPPPLLVSATATRDDGAVVDSTGQVIGWKWSNGEMQWISSGSRWSLLPSGTLLKKEGDNWVADWLLVVRHYPDTRWKRGVNGAPEMLDPATGSWVPQPRIQVRVVQHDKDRNDRALWAVERVKYKPAHSTS